MAIEPGIQIKVDARYASYGPMSVSVTMVADMKTYYANNGILDKAMEVLLVRRDAPGIRQVAKTDPHLIAQPDTPLPAPVAGKEPSGFIKEERILDAFGYGARHDGAANYFVVGVLAGKMSDPQQTSVQDHQNRLLAAGDAKVIPPNFADVKRRQRLPVTGLGVVVRPTADPVMGIEGAFRIGLEPPSKDGKQSAAFVSVVAARIDPHGGVSSGSFLIDSLDDNLGRTGQFFIPFHMLVPQPPPGRYRVLVFSADYFCQPFELEVHES